MCLVIIAQPVYLATLYTGEVHSIIGQNVYWENTEFYLAANELKLFLK